MQKEEGRREREEEWEMEEKLSTWGRTSRSVHSQLILLALLLLPKMLGTKKWLSHQLPGILRDPALQRKILLQSLNTISWVLREESSVVPKKKNAADWDPLIPWVFFLAFSLLSPGHNFWGLCIGLRKCWSIVSIFFLTVLQLAAHAYTNTTD